MSTYDHRADNARASLGRFGEDTAAAYLRDRGYALLDRNWRCGREGELDIVALSPERDCVVMVEVKTRRTTTFGSPLEAVTWSKVLRLRRLAAAWCRAHSPGVSGVRVDVIGVLVRPGEIPQITHVEAVTA